MATAISAARIDPLRSGKYPIVIGDELREETPRKRQRISVQYNYMPESLAKESATIRASGDEACSLSIMCGDGSGKYKYQGGQKPSTSLALIYDPEKQHFVLDNINTDFFFNLHTTPSNSDPESLAAKYDQVGAIDLPEDADGLFGDDEDEEDPDSLPADQDNPYDYRHFLHRGTDPSPQPSRQASPAPNHKFKPSPMLKPSTSVHRPRASTAPNKAFHTRQAYLSPDPQKETAVYTVEGDTNELVIDMGESEPKQSRSWHRAMLGAALGDDRGRSRKPMSMRSAASSMSPSVRARSDDEKDEKRDNDVEEINLGEPHIDSTNHETEDIGSSVNGNGWDDEDGDILEAELEQAMEQEAGGQDQRSQYPAAPVESSSESEEE